MPEATLYEFKCTICDKKYSHKRREVAEKKARDCETSHDIVYIALLRSDLQRLLAFITSKNDDWLTETLVKTLRSYRSLK